MPQRNYHHARREKERARKARQEEKQQRRSTRASDVAVSPAEAVVSSEPTNGDAGRTTS
jgi:hypothetical protein